jgi:hypothetical protein
MIQNTQLIFTKLNALSDNLKGQLRKKGFIIPIKKSDGSIQISSYKIVKTENLFAVLDRYDNIIVKNINLPQSAILIANDLGLKKSSFQQILEKDCRYGQCSFDKLNLKLVISKTKDHDRKEILREKIVTSNLLKEKYKQEILEGFINLLKIT